MFDAIHIWSFADLHLQKAANRNRCAMLQAPFTPGTSSRHSLIFFQLNQHKQETPPIYMVFFHVLVPLWPDSQPQTRELDGTTIFTVALRSMSPSCIALAFIRQASSWRVACPWKILQRDRRSGCQIVAGVNSSDWPNPRRVWMGRGLMWRDDLIHGRFILEDVGWYDDVDGIWGFIGFNFRGMPNSKMVADMFKFMK